MAEYDAGYIRCEQDVIAWLMTQIPVPVCQDLLLRLRDGAHRGCGPELDRQWEIPVTLDDQYNSKLVQMTWLLIRTLGGDLMIGAGGRWVVVPMFLPVGVVQKALCDVKGILSVGAPIRFANGERVDEPLIHILHDGLSICGYPTGSLKDWPEGKFVELFEIYKATCAACLAVKPPLETGLV